ncbi:hypothetical protein [Pseudomonas protegens]|uniref:hypothetical protein n=1 Tax=Pseudomonas protegens TaxID=380021 RepID=UPI003905E5B6
MSDSNIERFDEITGKVFAHLYQSFPIPTSMGAEFVGVKISSTTLTPHIGAPSGGIYDLSVEERKTFDIFIHSVNWLAKAGYIDVSDRLHTTFYGVTLTAKGLEVLKATPSSLDSAPSIGQQLITAAKGGFAEQLQSLTSSALKRGIALAVTAASELAIS